MLNDLLDDPKLTSRDYADSPNLVTGSIGRILGLDIYTRSSVLAFDSAGTAKSPFAAAAATDNASALLWHPDFVRFAYSGVKVYMQLDVPVAYGSQFSAMAMTGASKVYANGRGMVNIVEQP